MRFRPHALLKPVDPVVAIRPSSRAADESVAMLERAGFSRANLTIVGQGDSRTDLEDLARRSATGSPHWAASGTSLGLLWAAFTAAIVLVHPTGGVATTVIVTMGILTVLLQTAIVAHVAAPGGGQAHRGHAASIQSSIDGRQPQAWRFLVVVHGSRSDVALARALMSVR